MFSFFFKYPIPVFLRGQFLLLAPWPGWVLLMLIALGVAALALLIRSGMPGATPQISRLRAGLLWMFQSLFLITILLILWQPAITVAELVPHQNVIAVVLDDSKSMAIADSGSDAHTTRADAAKQALASGVLAALQKRFQVRLYRLDNRVAQIGALNEVQPAAAATHLNDGLKQFAADTADLPIGAVVLLSDGAENASAGEADLSLDTMEALRNRRLPVHTVGFGDAEARHDVELDDVRVAGRAMADARVPATVTFTQTGFAGSKALLVVRDGETTLGSREIVLGPDGKSQSEILFFGPGGAGVKNLRFSLGPLAGETNTANNAVQRMLGVSGDKRRILYVEGEPRWEYKFIRRAEDDDKFVQVASMLRTTENKIYRQGIDDPKELESGFPTRPEELFAYQGIIVGSVEAGYFSPLQQELLREFVDRRWGGLLFLGGRFSLADGGWGGSSLVDLLPTILPRGGNTFRRDPATAQLTAAGAESGIMRLMDDPSQNAERWKKLTYLMDYQDAGAAKPGATVLAQMNAHGRTLPLLVTQNYGRGRSAIMATSGTWRWQMAQPLGDPTHDLFWQQLLRWLVLDTPGQVAVSAARQTLMDDGHIELTANVRDTQYLPALDAKVTAHFIGPDGISAMLDMTPVAETPGMYRASWNAEKPGAYLAEITAQHAGETARSRSETEMLGTDTVSFERIDGAAENFHTTQNRELLEKLAAETGGRYWRPDQLNRLPNEISFSDAGISTRDVKELWNMPAVFLLLLFLIAAQWLLRRKWGVV